MTDKLNSRGVIEFLQDRSQVWLCSQEAVLNVVDILTLGCVTGTPGRPSQSGSAIRA